MQPKFHETGSSQVIEAGCFIPGVSKAEQYDAFRPSSQSWQARATERAAARHLAHLSRGSTLALRKLCQLPHGLTARGTIWRYAGARRGDQGICLWNDIVIYACWASIGCWLHAQPRGRKTRHPAYAFRSFQLVWHEVWIWSGVESTGKF